MGQMGIQAAPKSPCIMTEGLTDSCLSSSLVGQVRGGPQQSIPLQGAPFTPASELDFSPSQPAAVKEGGFEF